MEKKIIIMGASSGIGYELARIYIAQGWIVALAARRIEPLEKLQTMAPDRVFIAQIDITKEDAEKKIQTLYHTLGNVDLYLHVSGVGWENTQLNPAIEQQTALTNVMGFTMCIDTIFHLMCKQKKGHIAAISSIAGTKGLGPSAAYSATKAYQNTYMEALEQLVCNLKLNIQFTDIRPGFVDTPLLDKVRYPMMMQPADVANAIVKGIEKNRHILVIDWRYCLLTKLWRLMPRCLWRHLPLVRAKA